MEFLYFLLYFCLLNSFALSSKSRQIFDIVHEKEAIPHLKVKNNRDVKSIIRSSELKGQHGGSYIENKIEEEENNFNFFMVPETFTDDINFLHLGIENEKEKMKNIKHLGNEIVKKEKRDFDMIRKMLNEVKAKTRMLRQGLKNKVVIEEDDSALNRKVSEYKMKFKLLKKNVQEMESNIGDIEKSLFNLINGSDKDEVKLLKVDVKGNLNVNEGDQLRKQDDNSNTKTAAMNNIIAHEVGLNFDNNAKVRISNINDMIEIEDENLPIVLKNRNLFGNFLKDVNKDNLPAKEILKFTKIMHKLNSLCGENFAKCLTSEEDEKLKKEERVIN